MNPAWRARYELAIAVAEQAGQVGMKYFPDAASADFAARVEWKSDDSPVSLADREAEELLRTTLLGRFPDDGFLGEESGAHPGSSGFRWIIDPIDGTRSFIRGIPLWATLVGLEYQGEAIAGVTVVPALGHTYRALRGDGAYRGDRRLRVSDVANLGDALLFYSSLSWFTKAGREADFLRLTNKVQRARGFGDFYGFVLVAQGSGELMVEHGVHVWDVAALQPLIEEAGGRFSDWDGRPDMQRTDVVVSNGKLHEAALSLLRGR